MTTKYSLIKEIEKKLNKMNKKQIEAIYKSINDSNFQNKNSNIINFLTKHIEIGEYTCDKLIKISSYIKNNKKEIKKHYYLSKLLINKIKNIYKEKDKISAIKVFNLGTKTGKIFENLFAFLLKAYLLQENKEDKFKIEVDKAILIPNLKIRKRPDIIISNKKDKTPQVIIELKTSFTKSSLIKTYNDSLNNWKKINPQIYFYFIILNSSPQKTKTYKKINNCKIICNYLKKEQLDYKIIDNIEDIFNEINKNLK
jgi:hypothetical protein